MSLLLHADNAPVSDDAAYEDAVRLSLEHTMRQARALQQRYLALPMSMAPIVNRLFPSEVPEWSEGFCYAPGSHIPHDGKVVVICLLNKGHAGPCGGAEEMRRVRRDPMALAHSPLPKAWLTDPKTSRADAAMFPGQVTMDTGA